MIFTVGYGSSSRRWISKINFKNFRKVGARPDNYNNCYVLWMDYIIGIGFKMEF